MESAPGAALVNISVYVDIFSVNSASPLNRTKTTRFVIVPVENRLGLDMDVALTPLALKNKNAIMASDNHENNMPFLLFILYLLKVMVIYRDRLIHYNEQNFWGVEICFHFG
jgi:hypothetical protein